MVGEEIEGYVVAAARLINSFSNAIPAVRFAGPFVPAPTAPLSVGTPFRLVIVEVIVEIGVVMVFVGRSKYMTSVVIAVVVDVTVKETTTIGAVVVVDTVVVIVLPSRQ